MPLTRRTRLDATAQASPLDGWGARVETPRASASISVVVPSSARRLTARRGAPSGLVVETQSEAPSAAKRTVFTGSDPGSVVRITPFLTSQTVTEPSAAPQATKLASGAQQTEPYRFAAPFRAHWRRQPPSPACSVGARWLLLLLSCRRG